MGVAFIVATVLLVAIGAMLAVHPDDRRVALLAALLFVGLIAAYAVSRTAGIPLLHPHPEAVDAVGVVTKLVEALGLVSALWLSQSMSGHRPPMTQEVSP
jgi:hypothetical protein